MLNLEKNFPLIRALNALIHAKGNGNTLVALRELQHILATQASESDRFDAYISAKEEVRGMVLDLTEDLQDAHPELMPPQVLGYINELPEIRAICPTSMFQPGNSFPPEDIRPLLQSISQCSTPDSVHTVVHTVRGYLDSHPELRVAGYRQLLRVLEDEIIAAGMAAYPSAPDASIQGYRLLSLLSALEMCFDPSYAFDLMEYSGGTFTSILPESFSHMDNAAFLDDLLELLGRVLPNLKTRIAGVFLSELNKHLLEQIAEWTRFQELSPALDEEAKCRLDLLEELLDRGDDAEDDMDDLSDDPKDRLNCLYLSCAMGCHKDITYLLSDWDGWREIMADCLIEPQQLTSFAAYAVSVRLFLGVLVKLNPPPTLKALVRLYLVTASPDLSWVDYETAFHWIREPLSGRN